MSGGTPGNWNFILASDSQRERQTQAQLERVLARYDLSPWIRTRRVRIEEGAVPFSHPLLRINTRHLDNDDLLLATFIHEQIHWVVLEDQGALRTALEAIERLIPSVPVGHPHGANDERSSYLHVLVNYLEWGALRSLLGDDRAEAVIAFWRTDHYTDIYALAQDHADAIGDALDAARLAPSLPRP